MNRAPLPPQVLEDGVIAIFRGLDTDGVLQRAAVLAECGISAMEVTMDSPDPLSSIRTLASTHPDACVGAGTVTDMTQVEAAAEAGASFLLSPVLDPEVIAAAAASQIAMVPGALTPTEIEQAWALGSSAVKVFPAGALGAGYIASITAVLEAKVIATGGVGAGNARSFMDAGCVALGVGGALTAGSVAEVEARARALMAAINDA